MPFVYDFILSGFLSLLLLVLPCQFIDEIIEAPKSNFHNENEMFAFQGSLPFDRGERGVNGVRSVSGLLPCPLSLVHCKWESMGLF